MTPILLAAAPASGSIVGVLIQFAPFLVMLLIFYLVVFMPAIKKRKELQKTIDELKKGDKVVTNGGIYGEVYKVEKATLLLKVADNVRFRIAKSSIAGLDSGSEDRGGSA